MITGSDRAQQDLARRYARELRRLHADARRTFREERFARSSRDADADAVLDSRTARDTMRTAAISPGIGHA